MQWLRVVVLLVQDVVIFAKASDRVGRADRGDRKAVLSSQGGIRYQ